MPRLKLQKFNIVLFTLISLVLVFTLILVSQKFSQINELSSTHTEYNQQKYRTSLHKYIQLLQSGRADYTLFDNLSNLIANYSTPLTSYTLLDYGLAKNLINSSEYQKLKFKIAHSHNDFVTLEELFNSALSSDSNEFIVTNHRSYISTTFALNKDITKSFEELNKYEPEISDNVYYTIKCIFIKGEPSDKVDPKFTDLCSRDYKEISTEKKLEVIYYLMNHGLYSLAIYVGNDLIDKLPEFYQSYLYKGVALSELNYHQEALSVFQKAYSLNSTNPTTIKYYLLSLIKNQHYSEADKLITSLKSTDLKSEDLDSLYRLLAEHQQYLIISKLSERFPDYQSVYTHAANTVINKDSTNQICNNSDEENNILESIDIYIVVLDYMQAKGICDLTIAKNLFEKTL